MVLKRGGGGGLGEDEFFRNSFFFFDQSLVLSICNNIVVNNLYGFAKFFKPCLNFSTLSPLFKPLAEKNELLLPNFPIYYVYFIAVFVGKRLIDMRLKKDSLDKCVHVSLKIRDPGIQDVAIIPSLEGGDTQDKDLKGEIPAGAAASGECFILSYFLYRFGCNIVVLTNNSSKTLKSWIKR